MKINENYRNLRESYLFSTIAKKVKVYEEIHPEQSIIRLGIGDVTLPLCEVVIKGLEEAVKEMGAKETFHGYGPEQGYLFLREAIGAYYEKRQVYLESDEIFISDGAKSDLGNILDIFNKDNKVLIPDPVYPVYIDTNIMDGRDITFLDATEANDFLPLPIEGMKADIIYLCSPNNPTGAVYNREQLKQWVDYAIREDAIILFDAAYEAFIQDDTLPHSIFQIEGATECAIEFCSYSKSAGFTGTRCGYTVIPKGLKREGIALHSLWLRRQSTKFNGTSYIIQKGAAAFYTPEGQKQCKEVINLYMENARLIREAFESFGIPCIGGVHSPYIWLKCEGYEQSWEYFDMLLHKAGIVGTPGIGFGHNGEGYFRLTAFNSRENTLEAIQRLRKIYA
ncbi:MAG: LL-diaminopimelate aminotransferase [Cellulosilyticaceae bacterium]